MNPPRLSRRHFAILAGGAAAISRYGFASLAAPAPSESALSAQQVMDRIGSHANAAWQQTPPRGLIAGNPDTPVRGVATTAMATMDVLKQAAKSGLNLVLTYEPTYFSQSDGRTLPSGRGPQGGPGGGQPLSPTDPVLVAKKAFIEKNGLVIYRVGDHWQAGEDLSLALAATMGWTNHRVADDPLSYTIPPRTLGDVLAELKLKLAIRGGMRVVGDPRSSVQHIAVLPGLRPMPDLLHYLPKSDLVIIGETRDWEGPEYSSDANAAGLKKGYAQIGRVVSEDPGMVSFSRWLQTFVKEVPVQAIAATDPYWRPV